MLICSSLSLACHGTSMTKIPMHQVPRMDALLDIMATGRTSRLQQPGYIYTYPSNKEKKKKMLIIIKVRAHADVDHDHIIPKPQLMKRISHMGLPHNASHLIQGLSAGKIACFRLFSRHFFIFISRWAPCMRHANPQLYANPRAPPMEANALSGSKYK